ncbi:MAG: tetratricopeptide repeat protein [Verrucomicrobium sp.]|nr:tetratricopeptide repeat protein [Verrucomicrobium sp.]
MESRQWDRVLQAALDWLAEEPEEPAAHLAAGNALVSLDRPAEALPHLEQVVARLPWHGTAHRLLATAHFDLGNHRQADRSIVEAIRLEPDDFRPWYELARMCHEQHDAPNALKWATRALELAPGHPDVVNLYAVCGGPLGTTGASAEAVLALDPEHALAHVNLGRDHLQAGDHRKAEACFRRALAIEPLMRVAREDLLLAVRRRDPVYRTLCAPADVLRWIVRNTYGEEGRNRSFVAAAVGLLAWLCLFKFVIAGWILWLIFLWPMARYYEYLVSGDHRSEAGEIGARRGGFLGYRGWPRWVRLTLFAAGLGGFWFGILGRIFTEDAVDGGPGPAGLVVVGLVVGTVLALRMVEVSRRLEGRLRSWRRERLLKTMSSNPR